MLNINSSKVNLGKFLTMVLEANRKTFYLIVNGKKISCSAKRVNLLVITINSQFKFKCALSGLRQFLITESPLKMMKCFLFHLKSSFVLKIFKFLSWHFTHIAKQLVKKDKVNFKFYDVTAWLANNRNTHVAQYFER